MVDISQVKYSDKSITLQDRIYIYKILQNDYMAVLGLILRRSSLTEEEAMELGDQEVLKVLAGIYSAFSQAEILSNLAKQMEDNALH